jgi:hypothetical protein
MKEISKKIVLHPNFNKTIKAIKEINASLTYEQKDLKLNLDDFIQTGKLSLLDEDIGTSYDLNLNKGQEFLKSLKSLTIPLMAYDESFDKYEALEGFAFLTSHSLVLLGESDYLPIIQLTLYFYTKAEELTKKSQFIKLSNDPASDSNLDYAIDRKQFILDTIPENSIFLIDGPLLGGNKSTYNVSMVHELEKKNVIPIFFVKNSNSSMVTDNFSDLKTKFNSDLHWSYRLLKPGQRSCFFRYEDLKNQSFSKCFCYMKGMDISPQRVEIYPTIYEKHYNFINSILDLCYYLVLVQGEKKNPQIRTIAIAERYARESLKLFNVLKLLKYAGITPTMNEERFSW